jgi:hypothetical protein
MSYGIQAACPKSSAIPQDKIRFGTADMLAFDYIYQHVMRRTAIWLIRSSDDQGLINDSKQRFF